MFDVKLAGTKYLRMKEEFRHGFAREDVAEKKNAFEESEEAS